MKEERALHVQLQIPEPVPSTASLIYLIHVYIHMQHIRITCIYGCRQTYATCLCVYTRASCRYVWMKRKVRSRTAVVRGSGVCLEVGQRVGACVGLALPKPLSGGSATARRPHHTGRLKTRAVRADVWSGDPRGSLNSREAPGHEERFELTRAVSTRQASGSVLSCC